MGNVYFFQNADGDFVVGNNTSEVYPGGQYRPLIEKINGVDCFGIAYLDNANAVVSPRAATYFLKQNGTAYADIAEIMTACKAFFTTSKVTITDALGNKSTGIARGEFTAVLSDTEELAHVGWIQPRLAGGTIKYVTEYGETLTRVFDQKEVSLVKVKQIFLTGTTADLGITVFYE